MQSLFAAIVYIALAIVCFVVVIGGLVCLSDSTYTFAEYVTDLQGVYKLLVAAVISAIGHAYVDRSDKNTG